MMNKNIKKNLGFTLVEMLVVISIIGILSAVLAGGYVNSQRSSRDVTRKLNLKTIADALNSYYADFGVYPDVTFGDLLVGGGEEEFTVNDIIYIKKTPKETRDGMRDILYQVSATNKSFKLYTNLENGEDKDCDVCTSYPVSSGTCCYVITSSNTSLDGAMP